MGQAVHRAPPLPSYKRNEPQEKQNRAAAFISRQGNQAPVNVTICSDRRQIPVCPQPREAAGGQAWCREALLRPAEGKSAPELSGSHGDRILPVQSVGKGMTHVRSARASGVEAYPCEELQMRRAFLFSAHIGGEKKSTK